MNMRGKLEQPRGLLELISIETERIDPEYEELWISYEYTCPGGDYKSAMVLSITNSREMVNLFFRQFLAEARTLSEIEGDEDIALGFYVSNKADTMLFIKNLCQRVIDVVDAEGPLEENRVYIDLCTSGFDFKDNENSLSGNGFEERFRVFMGRAKEKMAKGYYTLAADDLEKAKILCSTSPLLFKLAGICHRELSHLESAMEMFERAIELGDQERDTYLYLAEVSFFLNDMEKALDALEALLDIYPLDLRAMVELANVRYQMDMEYIDIMDKAFEEDRDETRMIILQTFVFKKVAKRGQRRISIENASAMLHIPVKTIHLLAVRNRIPARIYSGQDEFILDEFELKAWSLVYRRYGLLQDEVKRVNINTSGDINSDMVVLP
ncbi:MAG: tetratricopeptide repeat protein [Thermodesulfobacteriota bacterium]|nr:tetratricopeptide repeat protein [Thermodesulfobacteriota bacterium]